MGNQQTFAVFNLKMPLLRLPAKIQLMEGTLKTKKKQTCAQALSNSGFTITKTKPRRAG